MKTKQIIALGVAAFLATIVYFSFSDGESSEVYYSAMIKEREEKDAFMKTDKDSPFRSTKARKLDAASGQIDTTETTAVVKKLNYFPPDLKYKVKASLESIENKKVIVVPTSDGKEKRYLEYARAKFTLNGQKNSLLIMEVMDAGPYKGTLFLAFADETSANETYGAGRYIELKKVRGATSIVIDFNHAYNPYCAYSDSFSCPFPPKENIMKIAIKAGEKKYHN
ncbi:MAG: DUF1684 domain-containing protein [Cyclobacteriaceae bacterium]|nr:DUF1684 domain-containing protein [Cyclobacteriaceae bacterium]